MSVKTEYDKINDELLEKHFPKQIAEDYYILGYTYASANLLENFRRVTKHGLDKEDAVEFIEAFEKSILDTPRFGDLFARLNKKESHF